MIIENMLRKSSGKMTVHELQKITGFLNFLGRAITPGRAFTRHLYGYVRGKVFKPHHHIRLTQEMK